MRDLTVPFALAVVFGIIIGARVYVAVAALILRMNKNVPLFGRREGIFYGAVLLIVAVIAVGATATIPLSTFSRFVDCFPAAFLAGAAIAQLWYSLRAAFSKRAR